MDSNKKEQHFFFDGLNTDNSEVFQPKNSYTKCSGFTIISKDENSYAIESELGNDVVFNLNPNFTPIGGFRSLYKLIIISTSNSFAATNREKGEFGMVDISPITQIGTYVPLYCHKSLGFKVDKQHEGHANFEHDTIQRAYTTDDTVPPKVLNYANPIYTTYFTSGGSNPLVVGETYMVLQGVINQGGPNYGPGEIDNVFVANAPTYVGTGLIIKYVPVELLDWVPAYKMGSIRLNKWLPGGDLQNGSYQVAFQQIGTDGVSTPWTAMGNTAYASDGYPGPTVQDYQGEQGEVNTVSSGKGLQFILENLDLNFNTIRVAAVRFTSWNVQEAPILIYDGVVTGPTMYVDLLSNIGLEQLTAAEIQEIFVYFARINTIQPFKNKMNGLNWGKLADIDYDPSTCDIKCIDYLRLTDDVNNVDVTSVYDNSWPANSPIVGHEYAPTAGRNPLPEALIHYRTWYEVSGGDAIYNGIVRLDGTFFLADQPLLNSFTVSAGAPVLFPCIRIQKYNGVYDTIRLQNDFYDSKGTVAEHYLTSNWRREKYRYAIQLLDLAGNPQYVFHAGDKTMIAQNNTTGQIDPETGNAWGFDGALTVNTGGGGGTPGLDKVYLRSIGIQIDQLDIQAIVDALIISTGNTALVISDLPKYFSGFRVVRAPRDKQVLAQGLMVATYIDAPSQVYCGTDIDIARNRYPRRVQCYCYYSPDINFQTSQSPVIQQGDDVRIEAYLQEHLSHHWTGAAPEYAIEKYVHFNGEPMPGVSTPTGYAQALLFNRCSLVEPNLTHNFQGSETFNNWGEREFGPNPSSVGALTYFIATANAQEGLPGDLHLGFGHWRIGDRYPVLVSIIRQKNNLYGGTSKAALASTIYHQCGHYQQFDAPFLAYVAGNGGKADGIQVFGGDCHVNYFDIARTMDNTTTPDTFCYTTIFPVEAAANAMLRLGKHPAKDGPAFSGISFPNNVEQWFYNSAFSPQESTYYEPAKPLNFIPNKDFYYQALYSETKIPGEYIDMYRKFREANNRNLEGLAGKGINLKKKNGKLFYWQENAVGYLPIEERTGIPVGMNAPLIIGVGGVMDRYDEMDGFYGNFHQFGLVETETGFIWFDRNKRAICSLDAGVLSLSALQGMMSFCHKYLDGDMLIHDAPVWGFGVAGVYESRFKRAVFVFRGVGPNTNPINLTLAYDIKSKNFVCQPNFTPGWMIDMNQFLYSSFEGLAPNPIQAFTNYQQGMRVKQGNTNYVCLVSFTTTGVLILPSMDTVHWASTSNPSQIYLQGINDYGKYFGIVHDEEFEIICNIDKHITKLFNNFEFQGNDVFFDDIICSTSDQNASDINIVTGVREEYHNINRRWYGTVPLDSLTGRLRDSLMKIFMRKKNRLNGNPTVSKNKKLVLSSIIVHYLESK